MHLVKRDRTIYLRVSRIKRLWLRRAAIIGAYPLLTLFGWWLLLWAVAGKLVELQVIPDWEPHPCLALAIW